MIGYSSTFMDKIIERADKRQERTEKMIGKMLDKSEKILQAGMTNEQWLRSCSMQELAEFIVGVADHCIMCKECFCEPCWCDEKKVVEWLKQPHTERE